MSKKIDLTGKRYGKLVVINESKKTDLSRQTFWFCLCDCGSNKEVGGRSLRRGDIVSCGCFGKEQRAKSNTKHGQHKSLTYKSWGNMIQRCTNQAHSNYKNYGGRGISICDEWMDFSVFLKDMGQRPSRLHSIERINNQLWYFKDNCRWATNVEQSRNKRLSKSNSSGAAGVSFNKKENMWRAYIWDQGKQRHLGYFSDKERAVSKRCSVEVRLWGMPFGSGFSYNELILFRDFRVVL